MAITFPEPIYPPSPGSPWHPASPGELLAFEAECRAVDARLHREKYSEGLPKMRLLQDRRWGELALGCVTSFLFGLLAAFTIGGLS